MPLTDQEEVSRIAAALENAGFTRRDSAGGVTRFGKPNTSERYMVWENAGWQHVRGRYRILASGNGIVNLKGHLRADREGVRSNWAV